MNNKYKKIKSWIYRDDLELNKKWWHRFLKVVFILSIICLFIVGIIGLVNSYNGIVNRWIYVSSLSSRLDNKVVSIGDLYGNDEIISDERPWNMKVGLENKSNLLPFSISVLSLNDNNFKTFCSDRIYEKIVDISKENNIEYYSSIESVPFQRSYVDIDVFIKSVKDNSWKFKCVMMDSYSVEDDGGNIITHKFLSPVDTYNFGIYKYKNGILYLVLSILMLLAIISVYLVMVMVFYYKVVLYVIYGNRR